MKDIISTMKQTLFLAILFLTISCTSHKAKDTNSFIYWVNSTKSTCSGSGNRHCLLVQKGDTINPENWQLFYSKIEGFEFEPGYIYKLKVSEKQVKKEDVPADASSIEYTLIKVLEKRQDMRLRINDIWVLEAVEGEAINPSRKGKIPRIEFNVAKMKIMGTDGCNNFIGSIKKLETKAIEFGPIAGTKKLCPSMKIPDKFNSLLSKTAAYKIEKNKLALLDASGKVLFSFKKTD